MRVRFRQVLAELRKRLIGRRPPAVDQPVGEPLGPLPKRLEGQGDDRRREQGEPQPLAAPDHGADVDHDQDIHDGDYGGEAAVNERPVDDQVDVVEAVSQNGDADCDGHGRRHDGNEEVVRQNREVQRKRQ